MTGGYEWDVLTLFDACVDLVVDLGELQVEFDQKEKRVRSVQVLLGGSTCIFASQCAKLGLRTTGVGVVGKDAFGQIVVDALTAVGVDTQYVQVQQGLRTSVGIALNRGEDRAILTDVDSIMATTTAGFTDALLKSARHLHLGSYYLLTGVQRELPELLRRAKSFGLTTSLDTNWDPDERWALPIEILSQIDYFFPNEAEIERITGESLPAAANKLLEWVGEIAVKKGGEGATLFTKSERCKLPPPKTQVVDTIGAGDSFDAGFVAAKLAGLTGVQALPWGLYCGSRNTEAVGGCAGQPSWKEMDSYLNARGVQDENEGRS